MPSWFPGAGFKRQAMEWRRRFDFLSNVPHSWVKAQIVSVYSILNPAEKLIQAQANGKHVPSFTSQQLLREDGSYPNAEEEDIINWCAGALYAGAADTVSELIVYQVLRYL